MRITYRGITGRVSQVARRIRRKLLFGAPVAKHLLLSIQNHYENVFLPNLRGATRNPWVQRASVLFVAAIVLISFTYHGPVQASNLTRTVSNKVDWEAGTNTNLDTESTYDHIQLADAGAWGARSLAEPPDTMSAGAAYASDGTNVYVLTGNGKPFFYRYNPASNTWSTLPSSPYGASASRADLVYANGVFYAIFGNGIQKFAKYDIASSTWTTLTDIPVGIGGGAGISYNSTNSSIYLMAGNTTTGFYRYDIASNAWFTLASLPGTITAGGDLVYNSGYVYAFRGNTTLSFYRYDVAAGTWSDAAAADLPAGVLLATDSEATLANGAIYRLRSGATTTFSKYTIATDTWSAVTATPANISAPGGLVYVSGVNRIYTFTSTRTFWALDASNDTWIGAADGPRTYAGYASLQSDGTQYLYGAVAGGTTGLDRYDTVAGTWSSMTASTNGIQSNQGVKAGAFLYYANQATTQFSRYDIGANTWSAMATLTAAYTRASLVYPGSGDFIYAFLGGAGAIFERYSISGNAWNDAAVADLPTTPQATTALDSTLVSDGTDIYALVGGSTSRFLKYSVGGNSWSELTSAPFPAGFTSGNTSPMAYKSGKIYSLVANRHPDFYEYTIASNSWRKLASVEKSGGTNIGPYIGAGLAIMGSTIYATRGDTTANMYTYTIPSNNYATTGSYISPVYDFTSVASWVSLTDTQSTPSDSSVLIETRSSSDGTNFSAYQALSGSTIQSPVNRYLQVRITLTASSDASNLTPTVSGYTVTYAGDSTAPTNPSSVSGFSKQTGGVAITSGNTYKYPNPYFTWSGATDAGSGVRGYYVYFGTNASADPVTAGSFSSSTNYSVNTPLTTSSTYYLLIKSADNMGNNAASTYTAFTYVYGGITSSALTMTSSADFNTGTLSGLSSAQSSGNLQLTSAAGTWMEGSIAPAPSVMNSASKQVYVASSNTLYILNGGATTNFLSYNIGTNTWTAEGSTPVAINLGGGIVAGPTGTLYGWVAGSTTTFMKYTIASHTWSDGAATDFPAITVGNVDAVYDGSRYIYALSGTTNSTFWRYDTQNDVWTNMANTNYGGNISNNTAQGYLAYDNAGTIYSIQTGGNLFAKYSIASNTWTPLMPSPAAFGGSTSSLVYDSTTGAFYSIAGISTSRAVFLKYTISSNSWSILPDPMLWTSNGSTNWGANQVLVGRTLYTVPGNNSSMLWTYNIDTGIWAKPIQGIFGSNNEFTGTRYFQAGGAASFIKGDGTYYYGTNGGGDSLFIRFDSATRTVTTMAPIPEGVVSGGSIVYDSTNNLIYATVGGNRDFFKYTISTNTWAKVNSGVTDLVPTKPLIGSDMAYDGSRYIYITQGNQQSGFYRYDTTAVAGSRWSAALATAPFGANNSSRLVYTGGFVYLTNVSASTGLYRYNPSNNTWSTMAAIPVTIDQQGTTLVVGNGGTNLYLATGASVPLDGWYSYSIANNTWSTLNSTPAGGGNGTDFGDSNGEQVFGYLGQGTNAISDGIYTYTEQTATSSFGTTGTYTSAGHDLTSVYQWGDVSVNYTTPSNTTVTVQTQSSPDNSTWSPAAAVTNEQVVGTTHTFQIASPVNRYLRLVITVNSDGVHTPTFSDYTVNYYSDVTAPTNPTALTAYDSVSHTNTLTSNTWYNYQLPSFVWPAAETAGGATDGVGSGVDGYYVYFGTNSSADPTVTSGIINAGGAVQFQTSTTLTLANAMTSGQTYYLRVKARDLAQNTNSSAWAAYIYKFDSTVPTNPNSITTSPAGYSAVDNFTFSWSGASDAESGIVKYQYRTGGDGANTWTDANPLTATTLTLPNADHPQGKYQGGANTFFLRTVDTAGNISNPILTTYYYAGSAPTPPENIVISPNSSTANSFTATWDPPATYSGQQNQLVYHWSVNVLPTITNTTTTSTLSVGPGTLATQEGTNTFYVVAEDGVGNVDYSNYGSATFTSTDVAPSVPLEFSVNDLSNRDAQKYGAVLSWEAPLTFEPTDFAGYKVYRSTDDVTYALLSSTVSTAYVDQGLTGGTKYYYHVTAYTKTNVESLPTDSLSVIPTGKFTKPPNLVSGPSFSVNPTSLTVNWVTDRVASSFVQIQNGNTFVSEQGDTSLVTSHSVTVLGLRSQQSYSFTIHSTDQDGNVLVGTEVAFTTGNLPSIFEMSATNITLTSAIISFKSTSVASFTLHYGATPSYGKVIEESSGGGTTNHAINITDLTPGTQYYYRIIGTDSEGNELRTENSFTTLPLPIVEGFSITQIPDQPTTTLELSWVTNVPTSTTAKYSPDGVNFTEQSSSDPILIHKITLDNLADNTIYQIYAKGSDQFGNVAQSSIIKFTTPKDTRAPKISNVKIETSNNDQTVQIVVAWTTDEPSTSQIQYAEGGVSKTYTNLSSLNGGLTLKHLVVISKLDSGKPYHLSALSTDVDGNLATSSDYTAVTGQVTQSALQIILQSLQGIFGWIRL